MITIIGLCETSHSMRAFLILNTFIKLVRIFVPLLLIITIIVKLFNNIITGKLDGSDLSIFAKKIIAGLIVIFVPSLVLTTLDLFLDKFDSSNINYCLENASTYKIEELEEKEEAELEMSSASYQEELEKELEEVQKEHEQYIAEVKKQRSVASSNSQNSESGTSNNSTQSTDGMNVYTKITSLGTLNIEKKLNIKSPSGYRTSQSFCLTNKYYIVGNINSSSSASRILIYDKSSGKLLKKYSGNFGHNNGMACNQDNNTLYIINGTGSSKAAYKANLNKISTSIDYSSFTLSKPLSGISYDEKTGTMVGAKGSYVYVLDSSLKIKKTIKKIAVGTPQDVGAANGIIYVVRYNSSGKATTSDPSKAKNALDLYRESDGAYLGSYIVNSSKELESVDYDYTDNKLTLLFNVPGSSTNEIYTTSI